MKKVLGIGVVCVLLAAALGWRAGGLPLTVLVDGARATADIQFLGEYPSDVQLIELEQLDTSQVIWKVVTDEEFVQIHQIQFVAGPNAADLRTSWGKARTDIPPGPQFVLEPHTRYRLRICSPSWWRRCASEVF